MRILTIQIYINTLSCVASTEIFDVLNVGGLKFPMSLLVPINDAEAVLNVSTLRDGK